jgi:glycosyltransferase involved in cell wall biosynthesis/GT2 family glycosyltransferase
MYRGRILAITDAPFAETGYGNQSEKILSELVKRGWEVYHICGNYFPNGKEKIDSEGFMHHKGIKCILNPKIWEGPDNLYPSKEMVKEWFDKLNPDCVWTLNDFYRVCNYIELGNEFIKKWVHWLPVDNNIGDKHWGQLENQLKFFVFLTRFGEEMESPLLPNVMYKTMIYHGINPEEFKPLDKKKVKEGHGFKDMFVMTTVARHQPRKMVYHTANAVYKFMQSHPDSMWVCKANPDDPAMKDEPEMERDLVKLAKSYGVDNRVMFVPMNMPTDQLNDLYNSGDIFITLPGGEGFNIPVAESMMAGVPCIVTNSTSGPELLNGGELGVLVPVETKKYVQRFATLYDIADLDKAIAGLEMAYKDWKTGSKILIEAGMECRRYAIEKFGLQQVASQWEEVFWRIIRYNNPVVWYSHFGRGIGFSAISEALVPELDRMGYDIYAADFSNGSSPITDPYFVKLYDKYLNAKASSNIEDYIAVIVNLMESFEFIPGNMKIGWSFSESTRIRSFFRSKCETVNHIVTSSDFNKEAQKTSNISRPVTIVPPCIDQKLFHYLERPELGSRPFTFLHIGVLQERKNPEQAIDAYVRSFPDDGKTKFIIKSNDFGKPDRLIKKYGDRKDIEFIYTNEVPLSHEELLKLYQRADCYVNVSHGEGIGMPDLEALATGLPVIGSNWDTRGLFLDDEVGWIVKVDHMDKAYKYTFPDDDCGEWAMFNDENIEQILKYVVEHQEEARAKGFKGSARVKEKFTVSRAAKELDELLMNIYASRKPEELVPKIEKEILKPNYERNKKVKISPVTESDRFLVAIPTKDRMESLKRTFNSLMQQSIKNFDIAVVDDTRDDRLRTNVEFNDMIAIFAKMGIPVYMIKGNCTNQADAHNVMLNHAIAKKYKLVFRCDDDVTLDSRTLEILFKEFIKDKECKYAAMGGVMLNPFYPSDVQVVPPDWRNKIEFAGKIDQCVLYAQVVQYPDDVEYRDDIEHLYSSYMYRPELMKSIGGFPSGLSAVGYREETYGLYELYLMGYKLKILPKAIGYHWCESHGGCRSVKGEVALKLYEQDEKIFQNKIAELKKKYGRD